MKKIDISTPKYPNKFALIDDEDFCLVSKYNWYLTDNGYARTSTPKKMYMHRLILGLKSKKQCDHINGNRIDNRKINLRACKESENHYNVGVRTDNNSGFRGVSYDKDRNKWLVSLTKDGKHNYGGRFKDINIAIKRCVELSRKLYGDFYDERRSSCGA